MTTSPHTFMALSLSLSKADNELQQLTQDGIFHARDGRPVNVSGWKLDQEIAQKVLVKLHARKSQMVVDYEHQTLNAERNGQPAPAAGWIVPTSIEYRPGIGLVAPIQWTDRAKGMIQTNEYAYLSPVIEFESVTGAITDILHIALTNAPALDGMNRLSALTLHHYFSPSEPLVNPQIIKSLSLPNDTTEQQIIDAIAALKAKADLVTGLETQVATLKTSGEAPMAVVNELRAQLAALKAGTDNTEIDRLITEGLKDGRIAGKVTTFV